MKLSMRKVLPIFVGSVFLQSCSSNPMRVSLTEMGTSSEVEYAAYNYRYMRTVNITGLSLEETPGSLTVDADKKSLGRFFKWVGNMISPEDLPDMMNPRVRTGKTVVQVSTACKISTSCLSASDAVKLKENIQAREILIGKIASAEVDIKALQLTKIAIDSKSKPEEKEALLAAIKQKFLENTIIKDATLTTYADAFSKVESGLRNGIIENTAKLNTVMNAINKPGVIVANWKLEKSATASASAPGASGAFSSNKDKYGYVIFINPTQITIELGEDIGDILSDMAKASHVQALMKQDRMYITTYQMRVSELIYSESLQSIIGANIDVKIDELAKTLQPLVGAGINIESLTGLKAQVAAEYKQFSFSSNQGTLSFRNEGLVTDNPRSFDFENVLNVSNKKTGVTDKNISDAKDYLEMLAQTRSVINQRVSFNQYLNMFKKDSSNVIEARAEVPDAAKVDKEKVSASEASANSNKGILKRIN